MFFMVSKTKQKQGFTIVELMVTIGIVMILALLAIPHVWRVRVNSNESVAVSNITSLNSVLQLYYINNNIFPESLSMLTPPQANPGYIDQELASGSKSGYNLEYSYTDGSHFYINANPQSLGRTGNNYFYIDETGVVRSNSEEEAGVNDSPLR